MFGTISLIIIFLVFWWYLVEYIKYFNTGDPNETDTNYWKFSYDFKPNKKEDFSPDKPNVLRRRRFRNRLVFLLYIDVLIIFFLVNILIQEIRTKQIQITGNFLTILNQIKKRILVLINQKFLEEEDLEID